MVRCVALLRGVNVGGTNPIKMSELKACFEAAGFKNVRTYINSGNVIFDAPDMGTDKVTEIVQKALDGAFPAKPRALILSHAQLKAVIDDAPKGFGTKPTEYHSDAIFFMPPLTMDEAMGVVSLREDVDQVWQGKDMLYFARLSARRVQSKLGKIIGTKPYKDMTIRSWSTTTKLLDLMDQ